MTLPLRVHEYGSPGAPDLVLLHGITDAGTTWPDAVARWEASWHILAVDQRGHGESPAFHDTQLEWMQDLMVADVVRTIVSGAIPISFMAQTPVIFTAAPGSWTIGTAILRAWMRQPSRLSSRMFLDSTPPGVPW